jgi:hypothetical protein
MQAVREQTAWRHLRGTKTEPAFAAVLRLEGSPYDALLDLQDRVDEALIDVLKSAGFAT